jgi:hypothetical protein
VPEPAPKRKTLAERAGETSRVMKRSNTTSTLRKPPGPYAASSVRPASAAANHRTNPPLPRATSRAALAAPRSIPSTHEAEDDAEDDDDLSSSVRPNNKRKGMLLPPIVESSALVLHHPSMSTKAASYASVLSRGPAVSQSPNPFTASPSKPSSFRNISLSTAFRTLSLSSNNSDPPSTKLEEQTAPPVLHCPKTPSQIPKPKPVFNSTPYRDVHIHKTPYTKYSIHNASPGKIVYLNRNSNTPAPVWDTKGRLEDMEMLYSQLKSQLDSAATEKSGMEEGLSVYRTRSMSCICLFFA